MTPILTVQNLSVEADAATGTIQAVRNLDLELHQGDIVGVIGESGSGKTTAVRSIIGLLERNVHIVDGEIRFRGDVVRSPSTERFRTIRGRHIGMVFQSPRRSLNPVRTIGSQLDEILRVLRHDFTREDRRRRIQDVLENVGFDDPKRVLRSHPHELSGGMCQRVAIAAAIAPEPSVLIADEATSALDVTTQSEVVKLLRNVTSAGNRSLLFVTHDLLLAAELCTRIVVMYAGEIVEEGPTEEVIRHPRHPYTQALLAAVPVWERATTLRGIPGRPPRVEPGFVGCGFADRCPHVQLACQTEIPMSEVVPGHQARCILVGQPSVGETMGASA